MSDGPGGPRWRRGSLAGHQDAPTTGERFIPLVEAHGVTIEEIVSSAVVEPVLYDQGHDEWVAVLAGGATLDVAGEEVELSPGDWLYLPAGTPHRVTRTESGTRWLAVHLRPTPE